MRALLVVNPTATSTSSRVRSVLTHALASDVKLEVAETTHRGHAGELAIQAADDGLDAVVVLGGDGTVNEVIGGLLAGGAGAEEAPALGVVPGGCANVFARALGLPPDPVLATALLLDALRDQRTRTIGLGRAGQRYFSFCAGLGMDAAAVRRVEQRRGHGPTTPWRYVRAATHEYLRSLDRRDPELSLLVEGAEPVPVHLALVCNARPWSYLGERPLVACPRAGFDTGLDVMALTGVSLAAMLINIGRMGVPGGHGPRGRRVVRLHDLPALAVQARHPLPFQVDGDYVGELDRVTLHAVPSALRVVV